MKRTLFAVKSIFTISDPNSTSSSDFKVIKTIKLGQVLSSPSSSNASTDFAALRSCSSNDFDSIILPAALYLSKQRSIPYENFKEIIKKTVRLRKHPSLYYNDMEMINEIHNRLFNVVKNSKRAPVPFFQSCMGQE